MGLNFNGYIVKSDIQIEELNEKISYTDAEIKIFEDLEKKEITLLKKTSKLNEFRYLNINIADSDRILMEFFVNGRVGGSCYWSIDSRTYHQKRFFDNFFIFFSIDEKLKPYIRYAVKNLEPELQISLLQDLSGVNMLGKLMYQEFNKSTAAEAKKRIDSMKKKSRNKFKVKKYAFRRCRLAAGFEFPLLQLDIKENFNSYDPKQFDTYYFNDGEIEKASVDKESERRVYLGETCFHIIKTGPSWKICTAEEPDKNLYEFEGIIRQIHTGIIISIFASQPGKTIVIAVNSRMEIAESSADGNFKSYYGKNPIIETDKGLYLFNYTDSAGISIPPLEIAKAVKPDNIWKTENGLIFCKITNGSQMQAVSLQGDTVDIVLPEVKRIIGTLGNKLIFEMYGKIEALDVYTGEEKILQPDGYYRSQIIGPYVLQETFKKFRLYNSDLECLGERGVAGVIMDRLFSGNLIYLIVHEEENKFLGDFPNNITGIECLFHTHVYTVKADFF